MVCRKCGKEIPEDVIFCGYCGNKTDNVVEKSNETNLSALIGFILSIISLFLNFWGVVGLASIMLSVTGLDEAKECGGNGKGLAIAGTVIGSISAAFGLYSILVMALIGGLIR